MTRSRFGYNVDAGTQVNSTPSIPSAGGYYSESNYENGFISSTATGSSTTTLTDTSQTWATNEWAGWTLTITSGAANGTSTHITSNTGTILTFPSIGALTGTPTYIISRDDMETYIEWSQNPGTVEGFRPWFYTFDRSTAKAQAALGTQGAITITGLSNTNPVTVTTSGTHGFNPQYLVRLSNLVGAPEHINGIAYTPTYVSATTFTIPVNGTSLGTYTASSGTVKEDPSIGASEIMARRMADIESPSLVGMQHVSEPTIRSSTSTPKDCISSTAITGRRII